MPYVTIRLAVRLRDRMGDDCFYFTERRGRRACYLSRKGRVIVVREFRKAMKSKYGGKRLYNIIVEEVEKLGRGICGGEYRAWRL